LWFVEDITQELAKDEAIPVYTEYNKTKFFKKWRSNVDLKESLTWYYVPYEIVLEIIGKLETGDFVNSQTQNMKNVLTKQKML